MEGTTTQAAMDLASGFARLQAKSEEEEEVIVSDGAEGVGTTKHPKTEREEKPFKSGVVLERPFNSPIASGCVGMSLDLGFARVQANSEEEGGVTITMDETAMYVYAAVGSGVPRKPAAGGEKRRPAGAGKRKRLVRLDKEYIEMKMSLPPPEPYRRMSDELLDMSDKLGMPERRAQEEDLAAFSQKCIERDAEMRRQYEIQGYADIEFTDDEDVDREDWRPWAYLKAAGLVDD